MDIIHQEENKRFVVNASDDEAILAYRLTTDDGKTSVDFYSTYVPPALRSQGIAEKLVRKGIAWAKAQGHHIEASCWYAKRFLR